MYIYMNAHIDPSVYLLSQTLLFFSINTEYVTVVLSREGTGLCKGEMTTC